VPEKGNRRRRISTAEPTLASRIYNCIYLCAFIEEIELAKRNTYL
jgi:hypothetical protein